MRTLVPGIVVLLWAAVSVLGPLLPLHPLAVDLPHILAGPGSDLWLGGDALGRPVLDRLLAGARISFVVAVSTVAVSLTVGATVGAASAWVGGRWDHVTVRVIDVFLAFPGILLAISLAGILGPGIGNVVIALSAVGWVGYARLARAQVLSLKHREHVVAAVALGAGSARVLRDHLLPLVAAPLIVEASFGLAGAIIAEAGLSFLGLGVQPPAPSWGSLIREGTRYMLVAPHLVVSPAATVFVVVLSINLLGDWLRDRLDVRAR